MDQAALDAMLKLVANRMNGSRENATDLMSDQAELVYLFGSAAAKQNKLCKLLLFRMEQVETAIDKKLNATSRDRVTERRIRTQAFQNDNWLKARRELIDAEDIKDALEAVLTALVHRKEMLVNVSATAREEMRTIDLHNRKLIDGTHHLPDRR